MRGRLALADIGLNTPLDVWLDAVYAVSVEAPYEALEKLNKQMIVKSAMVDPEAARETWGALPEHQAMAGKLGRQAAPPPVPGVQRRPQARE